MAKHALNKTVGTGLIKRMIFDLRDLAKNPDVLEVEVLSREKRKLSRIEQAIRAAFRSRTGRSARAS
ncbi:MAG: hypothetical protein U1E65_35235 [Myxococcota bacterium]